MPNPKTDAEYRIARDAETLVDAQVIRDDPKRFKAAAVYQEEMNKSAVRAVKKK